MALGTCNSQLSGTHDVGQSMLVLDDSARRHLSPVTCGDGYLYAGMVGFSKISKIPLWASLVRRRWQQD